jgi:hypothetical protein
MKRSRGTRRASDAGAFAALAVTLLVFFLGPYVVRGFGFPVGPDAPVYVWWTRLAGLDGLSAVHRPGVPALALVLVGTLHLPVVAVVAALEVVLGVTIGVASAALVRAANGSRAAWVLAGLLAGTFAAHLATGYLASLAFAALFLSAAVMLALATRRATVAAALLLGAGGLAHPLFFPLGALILVTAAALAWRSARDEAVRIGLAVLGGGAVLGLGVLALLAGPGPLSVDTSRDGFLRRAGLTDVLRSAYLDRFVHRWARYVQWASVPLAIVGLRGTGGFVGRFLRAWGVVLVAGVAFALATGLFPADRFITFGYVVPILAAYGLVRLWRALAPRHALVPRRALAILATGALTLAMLAGAFTAWARQEPFMSELEVSRVTSANPYAEAAPPGSPLVFSVNGEDGTVSFLATRAANVIRAGLPPDRIRDVLVVVPPPAEGAPTSPEREALTRLAERDAEVAEATHGAGGGAVSFLLAPFDRIDLPSAQQHLQERVATGVFVHPTTTDAPGLPVEPLEPSSPGGIALATFAVLALVTAIGYGWARSATDDALTAAALAPVFGTAALILAGIALERLGVPLTGSAGPTLVSALAGAGGYIAWPVLQRRTRARSPHEVDAEPHD